MKTFLNSSMQSDDNRIKIDGYNLIRSGHPSDSKKMEYLFSYKEHVPLVKRGNISTLGNFLVMEICSKSEKCF